MSSLLNCPFCGQEAEIVETMHSSGSNKTGVLPEGAVLVEKWKTMAGDRTVYRWKRVGYTPKCTCIGCIGRQISGSYRTKEEAISAWNKRA